MHYVLVRAEQYEKLRALFAEGEEYDPRELYPQHARRATTNYNYERFVTA
jgi:hypothetical protein